MVFNVPETIADKAAARHAADISHFQGVVNLLLDSEEEGVEVRAITRIGPYNTETSSTKIRPMKVIFTNPRDPVRLLRKGYKLAGQALSIRPDMDPDDRNKMKEAVKELRERKDKGEINLTIRNFRVVKRKRPRLLQQPMMLKAQLQP
jgi:ABC-type phosphate/phosphonate transport system substrate-binding protein